ncbi:MAG TPA: putative sugar nucleotidyl transferase [Gemmatimonadaceae bacterium]
MTLVCFDDAVARDFAPFALTRPACELRAGAEVVRRRWEIALGVPASGFIGAPHLADFDEPWAPGAVTGTLDAGTIVAQSRCAVALQRAPDADVWRCQGRMAAVRLAKPTAVADIGSLEALAPAQARQAEVEGWWLDQVWDLVRHLPEMLAADVPAIAATIELDAHHEVTRVGHHEVFVERGATLEPFVVFDASAGPVLVRGRATVQAFTRLVGPCYVGEGTVVAGGRVATSALGETCRVHGEVSHSIFLGHTNKAHDGFLGHSVLGRWVNLGAATVTSNLKNTYGSVSLWTPRGVASTGLQFLGAFIGDHARTGIGTRLTTGCVVGAGANVIADGVVPREVPPFAWGADGSGTWELERFLAAAERMMQRRQVPLTERARRQLAAAWQLQQRK